MKTMQEKRFGSRRHHHQGEQQHTINFICAFSAPSGVFLKIRTPSATPSYPPSSISSVPAYKTRFFEVEALRSCMMEEKMFRSIFKKHKRTSVVNLPAASISDLKDAVIELEGAKVKEENRNKNNTLIMHLSGHCSKIGGIVHDEGVSSDGSGGGFYWLFHSDTDVVNGVLVSAKRVADAICRSRGITCLVLSACDTIHFAKEVVRELSSEKYPFDIGELTIICTTTRVEDEFALKFTSAFYSRLLVELQSQTPYYSNYNKCEVVLKAFREARTANQTHFGNPDDIQAPKNKARGGIFIAERASNFCRK